MVRDLRDHVTSDPVRDRIVEFTRSMSAVTRSTRRSTDAEGWLSNGMTTATRSSEMRTDKHRNAIVERQVRGWPRSRMIRGPGCRAGGWDADHRQRRWQ